MSTISTSTTAATGLAATAATTGFPGIATRSIWPSGSFPWLLAHDLRLSRRRFGGMFGGLSPLMKGAILLNAAVAFHLLAWLVARWIGTLEAAEAGMAVPTTAFRLLMTGGVLFVVPWMIAQSLTSATRALYVRGDLDLLLSSPVSARSVLASRAVVIVTETVGAALVFLAPVINMCVLSGRPHWLAVYPTLLAAGFLASAIGISLAIGLFATIGPRRTRLVSQVLATIIGAVFLLAMQALSVVPAPVRAGLLTALETAQPGDLLHTGSVLWLPVRAAMGEVSALIQWIMLAGAAFALAAITLGRRFAHSVVLSAGGTGTSDSVSPSGELRFRFRTGLASAIRRKEWRLLLRDPWLSSQLALQIIYTLPVAVVLWRRQDIIGDPSFAVAPALVVIASQISASLSWLAVSGEDAREFLMTAPVSLGVQERRKLEAVAFPVAAIMALPLVGLAMMAPRTAAIAALFCLCSASSTALLNLWHPVTGRRQDLMRRHSQSKFVGIMEHLLSMVWVLAMMLVLYGAKSAVIPMVLAVGLLVAVRRWSLLSRMAAPLKSGSRPTLNTGPVLQPA